MAKAKTKKGKAKSGQDVKVHYKGTMVPSLMIPASADKH